MNSKRLLFTVLALGSLCCARGQNVYSLNVVGYYNVTLTSGYHFVANQLNTTNNSLHLLLQEAPVGLRAYVWDVTNQVFLPRATYGVSVPQWDRTYDLPVGRGFILHAPTICTVTFVGEVMQGSLTNFVAGSNKFSLLASKVPQEGALSATLGFPELEGANVHCYRHASRTFADACTYLGGHGWFDPQGVAGPGGPVLKVGESFFVQNPGPDTSWVRNFTVPQSAPRSARSSGAVAPATIGQLKINTGQVNLSVRDPGSGPYNVNFSADGVTWRTLATNQTGAVWSAPLPDATLGYFQLSNP